MSKKYANLIGALTAYIGLKMQFKFIQKFMIIYYCIIFSFCNRYQSYMEMNCFHYIM
ncbi:hypothetical protein KNP414_07458 [Paenibacillus mucilaginosus KNP414]|uniref:Uncharacterized protein n=1 Tax=Paenibacillus mucilaginosus (strain KNP414) TaxID=1036673 RepID=F8F7F3_PAEMK|nr:hypothetical protein KNP414_07458 [Paenibacillus mucilaginosus KNP414]